jgi:hypothetical protein
MSAQAAAGTRAPDTIETRTRPQRHHRETNRAYVEIVAGEDLHCPHTE